MSHDPIMLISLAGFAACLLWAVWSDIRTRRIPNVVSLAVALLWVLFAVAGGQGADWWAGLAVGAAIFAVGLGAFACGWFGGGDVKLMAAIGLWAGSAYVLDFILITGLVGGVLALITLAARKIAIPYVTTNALFAAPQTGAGAAQSDGLPYGLAIAGGGLWILHHMLVG